MARPVKQTVNYFPHQCIHGKTMYILEERYGNNGYSFWFKLLELLGNSPYHFIDCRNNGAEEFLQAKTHLDSITTVEILNLLAKLQAIDPELWNIRVIWCQKFVDGVEEVYTNRKREVPKRPDHLLVSSGSNSTDGNIPTTRNNSVE